MSAKDMPYDVYVDLAEEGAVPEGVKLRSGYKVAVVVDGWRRGETTPKGHIVEILGEPGDNDTEMHAILTAYGLPYRFTANVEAEAAAIPSVITDADIKGRRDFRKVLTFTIDPADAKDFDDALSFRRLDNGNYEVGVHIADVSWYVRPGTLIDKEACERGTSVYLVDRTVPMLPEKLSNNLCSLRPKEDKLTFSAVFEMTPKGKAFNPWFGRTIINSDWRFAYEEVQEMIEGKEVDGIPEDIRDAALTLHSLAEILRKKRFAEGAVNFERPEMKVDIDENGKAVGVHQRISKEANFLIEEFMLLANRNVAEFVATGGRFGGKALKDAKTFVYRVHDEPMGDKLETLRTFVSGLGYRLGGGGETGMSGALNALFSEVRDKPESKAIELMALRAMAKACYSVENIGHYGLAFRFYTHFTSPIRRYPDLMVHRLLSRYLEGGESADKGYFDLQCKHASERECIAAEAERESIKYKLIEYLEDKIGQEYDGMVSGLTEWGIYVEIEPTKIEGMVPLRTIESDFYDFDPDRYIVTGRRSGRTFRLGDRVRVKVKDVSQDQKYIDYELIEDVR
jgi:ribonuclease R